MNRTESPFRRSLPALLPVFATLFAPSLVAGAPLDPPSATASPTAAPVAAGALAAKRQRKPLIATVLAETHRVPGYPQVRPYTPPDLEAEAPPEPSDVKTVEITEPSEALVLARPFYPSPLLGAVVSGARAPIRGVVHAKSARGCAPKLWFALDPFGYICGKSARPSDGTPTTNAVLQVAPDSRLPFHYVMMLIKEGDKIPMWASLADARDEQLPERQLEKGDTVAVESKTSVGGVPYWVSVEGKVFPAKGSADIGSGSAWQGEALDEKTIFPFGWITAEKAKVFPTGDAQAQAQAQNKTKGPSHEKGPGKEKVKPIDVVLRRTRVVIAEEAGEGAKHMLRIGDGRWVRAADVNEVRKSPRPTGISDATQWIDVDLGEQVLVAYEGEKPVYATLTSSGRAIPTPRGNYPIWAKVSSISMKSQPYEDKSYFVNKVPWVLFFQAHNAIHGAYWHDRFGVSKSHGCVNVSPLDARHLFEWASPALPPGWTGYRTENLLKSPTVHVRNSHAKVELVQQRPIGPPDKELETQKLEDAEERRAAANNAPPSALPTPLLPAGMQSAPAGMKP